MGRNFDSNRGLTMVDKNSLFLRNDSTTIHSLPKKMCVKRTAKSDWVIETSIDRKSEIPT